METGIIVIRMRSRTIEISHRTVVFTILFLALVWLVIRIAPVVVSLFIAVLLATALNPPVDRLAQLRLPRPLAILLVYILLWSAVGWGLKIIISPLIIETTNLANRLPVFVDQFGGWLESIGIPGVDGSVVAGQVGQIGAIPANLVRFTVFLFSNLIAVIAVLVITFYMLLERRNLDKYLFVLFGDDGERQARAFVDKLEARLGGWVRGELLLMLIIGVLTYAGLLLLKIPYALPLAILAGVLEILPNIGPIVAAIPAILVGLTVSPIMALAVAALYFLVQQLENSVIVPKVMQRATGVNPLVTIVSLAVGFELAGAIGAILAVPIVIALRLVATDVLGLAVLQKLGK